MPIVAGDLVCRLTTKAGSAGNSLVQLDANLSLGKYLSTTAMSGALNAVFDRITSARNAASEVDYRCVMVANTHASLTFLGARLWLDGGDPAGGMAWAIAVDSTPARAMGSATAQALEAVSDTAPGAGIVGLAYGAPSSFAAGLVLGDIPAGYCRAVWVRRSATNSPATSETINLRVSGDTLA